MQLAHTLAFTQYGSAPGRAARGAGRRTRCGIPGVCVFRCQNPGVCVSSARISRKSGTKMRIRRKSGTHEHAPAHREAAESSLPQMAHLN